MIEMVLVIEPRLTKALARHLQNSAGVEAGTFLHFFVKRGARVAPNGNERAHIVPTSEMFRPES
jgi:hypothetical protein